jgi:MtN3 and saliva related transmembrane protein
MSDAAWYAVGSLAALLTSFAFVPQVVKMARTKSVKDISFLMIAQLTVGVVLWLAYGVHLGEWVVICANIVALATLLPGLALYVRYSRGRQT